MLLHTNKINMFLLHKISYFFDMERHDTCLSLDGARVINDWYPSTTSELLSQKKAGTSEPGVASWHG